MGNKLDVWKVTCGAFLIPWRNHIQFLVALANPVLLIVALSLSWYYVKNFLPIPEWLGWVRLLIYLVLSTLLAVTCHRLVLLNLKNVNSLTALNWSSTHTRFLAWLMAGFLIIKMIIPMILANLIINLPIFGESHAANQFLKKEFISRFNYVVLLIEVLAGYLFARVSILFPAVAVDKKVNLKWAWNLTKNNGWQLFLIVILSPCLINGLIINMYSDNPGFVEITFMTVFWSTLLVVEITAISLSYQELIKEKTTWEIF